ncbi:ATP-binding protein [Flindersiella endophytica]
MKGRETRLPDGLPDPDEVPNAKEFLAALRDLRSWAGQPSLRRLRMLGGKTTSVGGHVIDALPTSTISAWLAGKRPHLPRSEFVEAYVRACLRAQGITPDLVTQEVRRWLGVRHRLEAASAQAVEQTGTFQARSVNANSDRRAESSVTLSPNAKISLDAAQDTGPMPDRAVPHQLPAPPRGFSGRARELALLNETSGASDGASDVMAIAAIHGTGGVGKTWLAVRWAHDNLARFPDGQLYVNLRGFDPSGPPMAPAAAVRGFLDALGVDPGVVPADLDAQAALYRSLMAGKRMLILLDNARDTAHVEALLPGSPTCTVLVTSRNQLGGLVTTYGAQPMALDMLSSAEARQLLIRHLGRERIDAEPGAVDELVERCAGLPLALGIVAARAAAHPDFPLAALAKELADASTRLDALNIGDLTANLRAVFSSSHETLGTEAQRTFALLSQPLGPDISLPAVASLTAVPLSRARAILQDLEAVHLLHQTAPGRYRMHDLVRLYATERAQLLEPDVRDSALRRLVEHYLHTAFAADRLVASQHSRPIKLETPTPGMQRESISDRDTAWAWFDAEHAAVLSAQATAADRGWDLIVWQLARTLNHFHRWRGHFHAEVTTWEYGLPASERLDNTLLLAEAHHRMGSAKLRLGLHKDASEHLQQAISLYERGGDAIGQADTHEAYAAVLAAQGDFQRALSNSNRALHLFQSVDSLNGEAGSYNSLGWWNAQMGRYDRAQAHCEQALDLYHQVSDRDGEAYTLDSLGFIAKHTGRHYQALGYYQQALSLFRTLGNSYHEAMVLTELGEINALLGRHSEAWNARTQALELYRAQHRMKEAEEIQLELRSAAGTAPGS